jgi:dihydrofolate reductase
MKLTTTMFLSLDGVAQGPGAPEEDTSGGFGQGGWVVPHADEDFGRVAVAWMERASAFLLGRRTYDIFAAHWPRVTDPADPIATRLNSLPKYVVSRTLRQQDAGWQETTVLPGDDLVKEITAVKDQPGRELQIHGSPTLVRSLMAHDLIDEYRLVSFPVVLGSGARLFAEGTTPTALKLTHSETTSAGVVVNTYLPAGRPTFGAMPATEWMDETGLRG